MNKSLGQIAYEAFGERLGVELRERTITNYAESWSAFSSLSPEIKSSWEAVGDAVTAVLLRKPVEFAE
jgi:hypothetical protein